MLKFIILALSVFAANEKQLSVVPQKYYTDTLAFETALSKNSIKGMPTQVKFENISFTVPVNWTAYGLEGANSSGPIIYVEMNGKKLKSLEVFLSLWIKINTNEKLQSLKELESEFKLRHPREKISQMKALGHEWLVTDSEASGLPGTRVINFKAIAEKGYHRGTALYQNESQRKSILKIFQSLQGSF